MRSQLKISSMVRARFYSSG